MIVHLGLFGQARDAGLCGRIAINVCNH